MIGLDTNVLVRYLTQDDPQQSACANEVIETHCSRQSPGYAALVVLCELVWVLRGAYGYDKSAITEVLAAILDTAELEIENEGVASRALAAYREGEADFADYVITETHRWAGCDTTYSFDRKLTRSGAASEPVANM